MYQAFNGPTRRALVKHGSYSFLTPSHGRDNLETMPLKIRLFSSTSSLTTFFRCYTSQHGKSWSIARLLEWKPQSSVDHVTVNGYVRSVRAMKSQRFVMLGDGSCPASLQALVPLDQAER